MIHVVDVLGDISASIEMERVGKHQAERVVGSNKKRARTAVFVAVM